MDESVVQIVTGASVER